MAIIDKVVQDGLLVDRSYLQLHGIDRTTVDYYLRSGKIKAVAHGVYRKPGPPLKWQNVLYSLIQIGYSVHVGHISALGYHGFKHYLNVGNSEKILLYCKQTLPSWIHKINLNPGFNIMKRAPFTDSDTGVFEVPFGTWDWPIPYSTLERAFIELMSTIRTKEEIYQAQMMMEGAASLRPELLQTMLEKCRNIKAKRLFLWIARSTGYSWYEKIDTLRLDLGTGKRQIVPGGMLDKELQITVPKEDSSGQTESIF